MKIDVFFCKRLLVWKNRFPEIMLHSPLSDGFPDKYCFHLLWTILVCAFQVGQCRLPASFLFSGAGMQTRSTWRTCWTTSVISESPCSCYCSLRAPTSLVRSRVHHFIHTCDNYPILCLLFSEHVTHPQSRGAQCGPTPVLRLCTDTVMQTQCQSDKALLNPLTYYTQSFLQACSDLSVQITVAPVFKALSDYTPR